MASSAPHRALAFTFFLLLILSPLSLAKRPRPPSNKKLTHHGGPVVRGHLKLALLWYGQFGRRQKNVVRQFIKSLNSDGREGLEPKVSSWWRILESYQTTGAATSVGPVPVTGFKPRIRVSVVKSTTDVSWEFGKVITNDYVPRLVQKATGGKPDIVAVIFTARDVTVQGFCRATCQQHGLSGGNQYVMVGNPETECPGLCAWPFHRQEWGPQGVTYQPPNGDVGADAMVIQLATGLANLVTNPNLNGFYVDVPFSTELVEAGTACLGTFGSGAFPGFTGTVRVDPRTGGAFNAHGNRNKKFLLPAIWNPRTSSCWTLL
ncbi:protein EXORDIUM-like 6 [Carica papaya]|uniref:protein EXORDIUM-like 6 n=1 Tax=Carica papaya TaxID=3649 RepID=UPI000B8CCA2F|nr:protein EXORDIUM-like 6 [Carica papaya]